MRSRSKLFRFIALFVAMNMIISTMVPTVTFALTSGPSQPEFSSFEPVATTNMVNEFTGDFTYNLPVLEVPGPHGSSYPISLSYHSGVTPEEEASWVGYGWTLNAGAINRSARGLPDDYKNKTITNYNITPKNWTATVGERASVEFFSKDALRLSASRSVRYNNYRGFGENKGVSASIAKGLLDIGYSVDNGEGSFSLRVNPAAILNYLTESSEEQKSKLQGETSQPKKSKDQERSVSPENLAIAMANNFSVSAYGLFQYSQSVKSTQLQPYSGKSFNFSVGVEANPTFIPGGPTADIFGSYTFQENDREVTSDAFGYMYSGEARNPSEADDTDNVMDYHVENGSSFSKRDAVLGVPFNNADQFVVTGEGIGGGFRLYHKRIGHFGPRLTESKMDILQLGGEINVGANIGVGADVGAGKKTSTLTDWERYPAGGSFAAVSDASGLDEPVFFRFNNDMGGSWGDAVDDEPFQATVGAPSFSLAQSDAFQYELNNGERSGRSSFIGYNFNKDVTSVSNEPTYRAYSKRLDVNFLANKSEPSLADNIGELAIFNENGVRYIYGLPVYSRNEETLSYAAVGGNIQNRDVLYVNNANANAFINSPEVKVGESKPAPYATSFLLTEITTPDYVDRSLNGPSLDDFGGYTRFNYDKVYGGQSNSDWYKWRIPYNGLKYQRNSLSDPNDDVATVMTGEKEIYYLKNVETKSHVAVFVTSDRSGDALGALEFEKDAIRDRNESPAPPTPTDKLKRLDRIDLYAISQFAPNGDVMRNSQGDIVVPATDENGDPIKPIKTVYFKYAESTDELAKGAPNSNIAQNRGKLTLTRVYFEYNGATQARISPYDFVYGYPDFSTEYPSKYQSGAVDDATILNALPSSAENPPYTPFSSDAWGNYQPDGASRHNNMQKWLDQTQRPNIDYDPAAWHLKQIKLPSGGEIHVQYESDDYQFVQDQEAHVMASLIENTDGDADPDPENRLFHINPASIGVSGTAQVERLRQMIEDRYVTGGKKIYFKLLYHLIDNNDNPDDNPDPNLNSCNAEYITGYADVQEVLLETLDSGDEVIRLKVKGDDVPKDVCEEFTRKERIGLVDPSGGCNNSVLSGNEEDPERVVRRLLGLRKPLRALRKSDRICPNFNASLSYLRVPTPLPKRGGGLRVKRLLTFDRGLESNPVLYGNEYNYQTLDDFGNVISSGVATNEPQTMREENILVDDLQRDKQSFLNKIIAGKDVKQQEGPIGESIYPGPSVGYSRVAIRNIHSGKTNPGFTVNEYFTAKTHPIEVIPTDISDDMSFDFAFGGFVNFMENKQWASQGFSFILNNMHGQVRSITNYTGDNDDWVRLEKSAPVTQQVYEYYDPGEKVPVQASAFGGTEMVSLGREVDITLSQKLFKEESIDAMVEGDVSVGFFPALIFPIPIPFVTAMPMVTSTEGSIATHASSKVVRYPAIVKKSTTYQDGIYHVSEPLAFDKYTGKPVATKTYDEFERFYVSQDVRASWEYKAMSDKASAEGKLVETAFTLEGNRLKVATGQYCDLSQFTRGDLIELGDGTQALFHVVDIDYVREGLVVAVSQQNTAPEVQSASNLRIIRSGRSNALNASVGSFTRHNPAAEGGSLLASVDESLRYATPHAFVTNLNAQMSSLPNAEGTFTLSGPYIDMNMSAYSEDTGENIDWSKADVRGVEFRYEQESDHVRVDVMAFEIACSTCAGGWYRVAADGWD